MSLTINTDLSYIQMKLNISDVKMQEYQNMSVEEILDAEAASGNQEAIKLAADMFTDPNQLIELFQLADNDNKIAIMSEMPREQLDQLIPLLDQNDLIEGLNFFDKQSLLNMFEELPKDEMVNVVFEMFTQAQVVEKMPEDQIDKFLTSSDLDKAMLLKNMESIPPVYLQQMLESITGEETEATNSKELVQQIAQLEQGDFNQALKNLDPDQKKFLTFKIVSEDKDLFQKFDNNSYKHLVDTEKDKYEIVPAMQGAKAESLQKMITELPTDLLTVVLTQIDTAKFAQQLVTKNPEIIAKFLAS